MGEHESAFFKPTGDVPISTKDLLSWIFEERSAYPDGKPIYINADNPTEVLYRQQCRSIIRRLIAGLKAMSLQRGDCVCIHAFGNIYHSCIFLAVVGAGLVWTGTNPGYTRYELEHHLKSVKVKLVISESALLNDILPAAKSCKLGEEYVLDLDLMERPRPSGPTFRTWRSLMDYGEADWDTFDNLVMAKSTPACRLFSSGTTGLPKAATLSHRNLIAQHTLLHEQILKPYDISRILCLPLFHAVMVPIGHITPLRAGHTSYIMRRFKFEDFLRYTEKYKVTEIFVVPPIIVSLLQSPLIQKYSLRSLRWGMIGGAALNLEAQKAFTALINKNGRINCCYGITELSCIGVTYPWPEEDDEGSIGYFLPNLEVELVDDTHQEIRAYDTSGEIWIRGPTVIDGYFDNPAANKSAFTGDWFHTGDIGYCASKSKKWFIVDRKRELIKVRGFQVAPSELEAVLMSLPLISDAAVVGIVPDDVFGKFAAAKFLIPQLPAPLPVQWLRRLGIETLPGGLKPKEFDYMHTVIYFDEMQRSGLAGIPGSLSAGMTFGVPPIIKYGSKELQERFLPELLTGKKRTCIAITEPEAGSDVAGITTEAVRSEDGGGTSSSTGQRSGLPMAVRTGGPGANGLFLVVVPLKDYPGVSTRKIIVGGQNTAGTAYIELDDVKVPVENIIGKEGQGMKYIMTNFNHERLTVAIGVIRQARVTLSAAFEYCMKREAFGKTLMDQPVVRHRLAKSGAKLESIWAWLEQIAIQMSEADMQLGGLTALAKAKAAKVLDDCARCSVLLFGGNGFTQSGQGEIPKKIYREVNGARIPGGSEDVMLDLAIRQLLLRYKRKMSEQGRL